MTIKHLIDTLEALQRPELEVVVFNHNTQKWEQRNCADSQPYVVGSSIYPTLPLGNVAVIALTS